MRIYLAGPMRGHPACNYPAFHQAALKLRGAGYTVISPAEHNPPEINGAELRQALLWDFEQVLDVDAIVTLPGWSSSKGASAEVAIAEAVGTPHLELAEALHARHR
jgi:hypothetical protein